MSLANADCYGDRLIHGNGYANPDDQTRTPTKITPDPCAAPDTIAQNT